MTYAARESPAAGLNALCEPGGEQDIEEWNSRGRDFPSQSFSEDDGRLVICRCVWDKFMIGSPASLQPVEARFGRSVWSVPQKHFMWT